MNLFLEFSLIGLASGGIYVLAALSFVIVYKATNIFNFATGEMMMFGTYFFYLYDTQLGFGWVAGLGMGLASAALLALVIERAMLRPLHDASGRLPADLQRQLRERPPVPCTSIYTMSDGAVPWSMCVEPESLLSQSIVVPASSHRALADHPEVRRIIVDRMAQPDGEWRPFAG